MHGDTPYGASALARSSVACAMLVRIFLALMRKKV